MSVFDITRYRDGIPRDILRREIADNAGKVFIDYLMSSIHRSNSYLDVTQDYLEASYIAEELGILAKSIKVSWISQYPHPPKCRFEIMVDEVEPFIERTFQLSVVFSGGLPDGEANDFVNELQNFEDTLNDRKFFCPEIIDDYYANLVIRAYPELELNLEGEGFLAGEYAKYPEREYGFWKSAYSNTLGEVFYQSLDCWAVPDSIDIQKLLSTYSWLAPDEEFDEASLFSFDNASYLRADRAS